MFKVSVSVQHMRGYAERIKLASYLFVLLAQCISSGQTRSSNGNILTNGKVSVARRVFAVDHKRSLTAFEMTGDDRLGKFQIVQLANILLYLAGFL
jgi:hypothetical protein